MIKQPQDCRHVVNKELELVPKEQMNKNNQHYVREGEKRKEKKRNEGRVGAKMAQYHHLWKFLARKHCFGNNQQSTTFSRTRVSETRVPHQFSTVALLSWIYAIKKFFVVLELGKLEYHLHSTRVYQARVPIS